MNLNQFATDTTSETILSPSALESILKAWPDVPSLQDGHLRPDTLATIHSYTNGHRAGDYLGARERLSNQLIAATIYHASSYIPAYREYDLKGMTLNDFKQGIDTLKLIRPVDRSLVQENVDAYIAQGTTFCGATFTSGTTLGIPLMCERSVEEINWLSDYYQATINHSSTAVSEPLCISITTANHGFVVTLPGRGYSFSLDLRERSAFQRAKWLLQQQFSWPGYEVSIRFVSGSFRKVYLLGLYLANHDALPSKGQIQGIQTYGSYADPLQKQQLEAWFGCRVTDVFSMSEFVGSATFCSVCGGFHMPALWHVETIPLCVGSPLGELVITPLFPGTWRFMPLRYRTGDLVAELPSGCSLHERAYRYYGRLCDAFMLEFWSGKCLPSIVVANVLSQFPDVARDRTKSLDSMLDASSGKAPEFDIAMKGQNSNSCILLIKLVYDPILFPTRSADLIKAIRFGLLDGLSVIYSATIAESLVSTIEISLVEPNYSMTAPDVR